MVAIFSGGVFRMPSLACPLCKGVMNRPADAYYGAERDLRDYSCGTCGDFELDGTSADLLATTWNEPRKIALVRHVLAKMHRTAKKPALTSELLENLFANASLPMPQEQGDNLILWLGENNPDPGEHQQLKYPIHGPIIGSFSDQGFSTLRKASKVSD
jgi:hypothetical protein